MFRIPFLPLIALSGPAFAHPGHLQTVAGHSHWLALAAFGSAGVIALIGIARAVSRRRAADAAGDGK